MKFFNAFLIGTNTVFAFQNAMKHDWGWLLASLTMIAWCSADYFRSVTVSDGVDD